MFYIMYTQTCTRTNISFIVSMLGRDQSIHGLDHWKADEKVLRYLQGTMDYMLMYKKSEQLEMIGYLESEFAGCLDSKISTFDYLLLLASGAISQKSVKESIIASFTMEVEFVACFEATTKGLWLRNFTSEVRVVDSIAKPLKIYCGNSVAVFFYKNNKYSKGDKHMELNILSLKKQFKKKESIEYISTGLMA